MNRFRKTDAPYRSWGNYPNCPSTAHQFLHSAELRAILDKHANLIPYGNGRSYGDSALGPNLIDFRRYNYFLDFDENNAILHCQAGVLLSDILDVFVPRGWFLPVTPGTKFITVGGAIASDVHGKNHHVAGSFSDHILDFELMLPNGAIVTCSPLAHTDLFRATCGGMGLTGLILTARIKMSAISSSTIAQVTIKTQNLADTFNAFEQYGDAPYSVAWIDCLATGDNLGRCLMMTGEHATDNALAYEGRTGFSVPCHFPGFTLNNWTVKAFNALYYAKARRKISRRSVPLEQFFYPLDAIAQWNRIYGKNGFTQYQFVLPLGESLRGLERILTRIAVSGKGSFLAVLKRFGPGNANWLSFPMEGYTLALDFKMEPDLFGFLDALDRVVLDHGGRFYLTKDCRVPRGHFEPGYPNLRKFRELRQRYNMVGKFNSLQSERLAL
ncbi:MAG: FAD-binding oxidoreductase [Deltaproteobacteria bacterium]|nr:FAD-binding oxidoreductase [Deltaproteobacteria bacterium]